MVAAPPAGAAGGGGTEFGLQTCSPQTGADPGGSALSVHGNATDKDRGRPRAKETAFGGIRLRVVVGITGASGVIYGVRLLSVLREAGVETHLIISRWGAETIREETGLDPDRVRALAYRTYSHDDLAAPPASGSFPVDAMAVVPCSMKTVAAIAHGFSRDLISRAADVCLKERRRLVVVPRETPLSPLHLENLLRLARLGVVVLPPVPAFYLRPASLEELVDGTVGRILDHLGVAHGLSRPWGGPSHPEQQGLGRPRQPGPPQACRPGQEGEPGDGRQGEPGSSGGGGGRPGVVEVETRAGEGRLQVVARGWDTGRGYVVGLFGGESPHVGAVVVSMPRPSLADPGKPSCTSSVINLPAHKEEEVIRPLAEELARATGRPVVGVAGVHVEGADPASLDALVHHCREAGRRLVGVITRGDAG